MGYRVRYASINLENYFNIHDIERTIMSTRNNFTKNIPALDGLVYSGHKYDAKKIVLKCSIVATNREDYLEKVNAISFLLDSKTPNQLVLGDMIHFYYNAVFDGEIKLEKKGYTATFELTFLCLDPHAYSFYKSIAMPDSNGRITINNAGNSEAYPATKIIFSKPTYFVQCTNYKGETILVGSPPKLEEETVPPNPVVLRDACESLSNWTSTGNVMDANRETGGNITLNAGGYGFMLGSANTGETSIWSGASIRRNLPYPVEEFAAEVKVDFISQGDLRGTGGGSQPPSTTEPSHWVTYTVTQDPTTTIRDSRGGGNPIGHYLKDTVIKVSDIKQNWGYVGLIEGKKGYINMSYVKLGGKEENSDGNGNNDTDDNNHPSGTYVINTPSGVSVREDRGTHHKALTAIPNGTTVKVTDIKDNWGKVTYNYKTGYIAMQYTKEKENTRLRIEPSAENKIGLLEVYGFDQNGNKLFKLQMEDSQKWYEYTDPMISAGSNIILDDNSNCPSPQQESIENGEGKYVYKDTDSGRFGDWNNFRGWLRIERKIVNGVHQWYALIDKYKEDGHVEKIIHTNVITGHYPAGKLSNLVIYLAKHKNEPVVDVMTVNEIKITNLGKLPTPTQVQPIFEAGDELVIDNATQKVYKNGRLYMKHLDIGSQFFGVPTGNSQMIIKSDDENMDVITIYQTRNK